MTSILVGIDTTASLKLTTPVGQRPGTFAFNGDCFEATVDIPEDAGPDVLQAFLDTAWIALGEALYGHFGIAAPNARWQGARTQQTRATETAPVLKIK